MRIVNPLTKTVHYFTRWTGKAWRITSKGKRRSYIKHYAWKKSK